MDWPFAEYEPIEPLGAGGLAGVDGPPGGVWLARRPRDGAEVAIKILPDRLRAEREATIARAVDHPHVMTPLAVLGSLEGAGLVTAFAARGSVADLLRARHRIPWAEALTVLIPMADALAAAHERDLVHGDISAANILIDGRGRPLLADFGAARAHVEAGGAVAATPTDVAPEIVRGAAPSPASDLFSLGSVALRCLTGRSAWPAADFEEVLVQSAAGQWPDIDDAMAPPALCALVRRLLAPEPSARGSAASLAVDLRAVGRPEPLIHSPAGEGALPPATAVRPDAVRPPGTRGQASARHRVRSRHRMLRAVSAGAIVAVLIAGAITVGWWWSGSGHPARPAMGAVPVPVTESEAGVTARSVPASRESTAAPVPVAAVSEPAPATVAGEASEPSEPGEVSQSPQPPQPSGLSDRPSAAPETGTFSDPDWWSVVEKLDRLRADAFDLRDAAALAQVYTAGAEELRADTARIEDLRARGLHPGLVAHQLTSVSLIDLQPDGAAIVEVRGTLPATIVRDDDGDLVGRTDAAAETSTRLRLAATAEGYRIDRILPAVSGRAG